MRRTIRRRTIHGQTRHSPDEGADGWLGEEVDLQRRKKMRRKRREEGRKRETDRDTRGTERTSQDKPERHKQRHAKPRHEEESWGKTVGVRTQRSTPPPLAMSALLDIGARP
eukprot:2543756-Rhodomonas_salina.1